MSGFTPNNRRAFELLYVLAADMNVTTDQAFTKLHSHPSWTFHFIRARNPSISLTTAEGGIYSGAAKSGVIFIAATQVYSSLNATGRGINVSLLPEGMASLTVDPILSLSTPQGAAATCTIEVFGWGTYY